MHGMKKGKTNTRKAMIRKRLFMFCNKTAVFMYEIYVVCVCSLKGIMYSYEGWDQSLCWWLPFFLAPTQSPTTSNTHIRFYPQQSAMFQHHGATLGHIYISIRSGLSAFNSTSLRQSFAGCAIHDRLCTEYELWIMQNAHKHQGYSQVNSD